MKKLYQKMDFYLKICNLVILLILIILNCPLIFSFISIRGAVVIFHYWFIFSLMFVYHLYMFNIEKHSDEQKTKITKKFYDAIHEKYNVRIRFSIYILYASLFISVIYILIFSNDKYMTTYQQVVYSINFIIGTIISSPITEHDYFYTFCNYENILFVSNEKEKEKENDII